VCFDFTKMNVIASGEQEKKQVSGSTKEGPVRNLGSVSSWQLTSDSVKGVENIRT